MTNILTGVPSKKEKLPLSVTHPELAKEAVEWNPDVFTSGSSKKMRWRCEKNHEWEAAIGTRALRKLGCPYCSNQKVLVGYNDLATTHPELASELVNSKGTEFVAGSQAKAVEWRCSRGHIYSAKPANRAIRMQGCPVCSGRRVQAGFNDLETTHPELSKEAYDFDPKELSSGSHKVVKWRCPQGHIYSSVLKQRTTGKKSNCSVCSGDQVMQGFNDLATSDPELSLQAHGWDPKTITRSSNKRKEWICELSHIWSASPNSRTNMNSGCPVCAGRQLLAGYNDLATMYPALALQADGWDPNSVLSGTHKKYGWICSEGHKWKSVVKDRTSRGDGCPSCAKNGFIPSRDGYLYFISHPIWEMLQIGITNHPQDRLQSHKLLGWELLEIRGPMDGYLAQEWEKAILRMLKANGADLSNDKIAGKFDGYSEAWSKSKFKVISIRDLMSLVDEFESIGKETD